MADKQALEVVHFEKVIRRLEFLRRPENRMARRATVLDLLEKDPEVYRVVGNFLCDITAYDGQENISVARLKALQTTIHEAMERAVANKMSLEETS